MKRVLACLTAALLVLGITACGGAPAEKQPQDDSQPEKVTITYLPLHQPRGSPSQILSG